MTEANDELLLALTNDAIRHADTIAGDNAYYLRHRVSLTTNAPPAVTTMPAVVKRLYRLERDACPGSYVEWTFVRHDDSGNTVILANEAAAVSAHYHEVPAELVSDLDESPFPWQHEELIVTMVLVRLAQTFGSEELLALLTERQERLLSVFKRDCLRYESQRHESITTIQSRESWGSQPWMSGRA